jgi:Rod binding domain-containing protein
MDVAKNPLAINPAAVSKTGGAAEGLSDKEEALRKTAEEFESVFIAEMLSHAGFDKAIAQDSGFGGEAFSRMLVETYAENLAKKGGFGLADQIYRQLKGQL